MTCPLKDSKPRANRNDIEARFCRRIESIAQQRDSGYPLELGEMTALEFQGLLLWDDEHTRWKRSVSLVGITFKRMGEEG